MSDNFFLDTNIIVYNFDPDSPLKLKKASELIKLALVSGNGFVSYQVIQEFINVAVQKFKIPLTLNDCKLYVEQVLSPICSIFPDIIFYKYALTVKEITRFSFYDSLIVAAAKMSKCTILYTEDMQDGFCFDNLIIKNPFL